MGPFKITRYHLACADASPHGHRRAPVRHDIQDTHRGMSGRSDGAAHGRGARQVSPTAPSTTAESFGTPIEESTLRRDRRPSQPSRRSPPVTAEDARARAGRRTRPGPPARYVPTRHLSLSEARPTAPARRQISAPSTYLQPGEAGSNGVPNSRWVLVPVCPVQPRCDQVPPRSR